MMRRFVSTIDLVSDAAIIAEYDAAHSPGNVPPAVLASQRRHGIIELIIYRTDNRLVMVMEVDDAFDASALNADATDILEISTWHDRMGLLQQPFRRTAGWAEMAPIFRQSDHP